MPRKSAAELSIIPPPTDSIRLQPPASLVGPERKIFTEIVASCADNHFRPSDAPLLCAYCGVIAQLQTAVRELKRGVVHGGKVNPWVGIQERLIKSMVALSMRLRLSPQARAPNNPGSKVPRLSVYETMDDSDD